MAKQTILWTALPNGRSGKGDKARLRISIVVSPRLTPQSASEQTLQAFSEFNDWPSTLAGLQFSLRVGSDSLALRVDNQADSQLWKELLPLDTPVAGFQYKDMSKVNLRSFPVRNVLSFVRRHYSRLAAASPSDHPRLLPWNDVDPTLKNMLESLGTRTYKTDFSGQSAELPLPGFSRFFDPDNRESPDRYLNETVFSDKGRYRGDHDRIETKKDGFPADAGRFTLRVLPPDWRDPIQGGPDADIMGQFSTADEYTFYQADRFYRRVRPNLAQKRMRRPIYNGIAPPPAPPEYDFHRIVASYADYPWLLRRLGLIIDCEITERGLSDQLLGKNNKAHGKFCLQIKNSNAHDPSGDALPCTAWQLDEDRFITRPKSPDHERGLLRLQGTDDGWGLTDKGEDSPFDVYQLDPDGAAMKTVGFTLSTQNLLAKSLSPRQADGETTYTTGDLQPVAGMRSGGFGISRHGRAIGVAQDAASATLKNQAVENQNAAGIVLFAEDVLRGYRVDVAPVDNAFDPGPWHSLCARQGSYRLLKPNKTLQPPPDEGYVKGASTTQSTDASTDPDDHYLHESLFRWTGWSMCTPRPGRTLRGAPADDSQLQAEESTTVNDVAADGNGVAAQFTTPPRSLPKLRYGQRYRMRARMVDLAGNSLAVDDPTLGDFENATDAVGYWRFEPVDPPVMQHRHRVSEGESLERMVIRSNYDADTTAYRTNAAFSLAIADPASADFEYLAVNERHLVPPKSSQQQCEQHRQFDPYFSSTQDIKKGYEIAAREAGSLYDTTAGAQIELVTPSLLNNVAQTSSVPPAMPSADNPVGDRFSGGQYILHREAQIDTPYLPDAAAAGIALFALPGHDLPGISGETILGPSCVVQRAPDQSLVLLISHSGDWPDLNGCRIELRERDTGYVEIPCAETDNDDGLPQWNEAQRVLTLFLRKGEIVRLGYSSFVDQEILPDFGLPRWMLNQSERQIVIDMAHLGRHWMLCPFRRLTLVHATQQPVCLPELYKLQVSRDHDAQHAMLRCPLVRLHGPSSGKFEIQADWTEWVDDLEKPRPVRIEGHGQLGEIPLNENHRNTFPLDQAINAQRIAPDRDRARGDRHDFGDTRFRLIEYRVMATTRFREYLPPSLYAQTDKVTRVGPVALGENVVAGAADDPGAPVLLAAEGSDQNTRVLASAPPDDPRVLYTVPTFRWDHGTAGPGGQVITRHGNGLRVWLDRPWFSSGDGELLGVVLFGDSAPFTDVPAHMLPLVTMWGLDPLWETALPKSLSRASDFTARVNDEAVKLQERPDSDPVQVVGHRVHWDDERRLWYCDIEINAGLSYMPFVRLALVRYQPNALPTAKISKVVLSEFAQVLPRRRVRFTHAAGKAQIALNGIVPHYGPMKFPVDSEYSDISFVGGTHETGRNRVELVLQTRDPAIDSDLAWQDISTLASSVAQSSANNPYQLHPTLDLGRLGVFEVKKSTSSRVVQRRAGGTVRLDDSIRFGPGIEKDVKLADRLPKFASFTDPEIWDADVDIPDTQDRPARLMIREFERYYTDRTVPERRGSAIHRRRVIEERLVYSAVFNLS